MLRPEKLSQKECDQRRALDERLDGRSPVAINVDDIGTPHLVENSFDNVIDMLDWLNDE